MIEVTDPNILKRLEGGTALREVTDPSILEKLESSPLKRAGKFASEYYDYLHQPTEPPTSVSDFAKRVVPDSISKTAVGLTEFPYKAGYQIGEQIQQKGIEQGDVLGAVGGVGIEIGKMAVGMAEFVGEPFGLFGLEKAKERWLTDPAGSIVAAAPIVHAGIRGAAKMKGKPAVEAVKEVAPEAVKEVAPETLKPVEDPAILKQLDTPVEEPVVEAVAPKESILSNEKGSVDVTALRPVAEAGKELSDAYRRPPEITETKKVIGEYTGALQVIDHDLMKVAKDINKRLPKDRQEAVTNYMQAGGDEVILKDRAAKANPKYRKGYEDATKLTPEEKAFAEEARIRQDQTWQLANDAGILESYVDHYVRGEWERPDKAGKKLVAQVSSGMFRTKPREALKKVFQDYYEGEQAGFTPKNKSIGYQIVAAERSLKYAIEAKKALKALMNSKEKDGRPTVAVGGGGSYRGEAAAEQPAYYIKPNVLPKEAGDYKYLDHPSLRSWKWVDADSAGKPILLEGDMWIHPQAYSKVNALLGRSKIAEYTVPERIPVIGGTQPGRAALKAGAFVKGTILLGPFHQVHVGIHAVFHKVKPFSLPEINFETRPILREGIDRGLMLSNHNAMAEFGEGLSTGGLFHRIPGIGTQLIRYQEWLFQNYIPKLKASMFEHAVERAEKYYKKDLASGRFTRDQLLENAAKQANAAFGEQNYRYIGRNPTVQDALRIALLAPDFLEARLKFAGQALRPYGKEQSLALVRGALLMATTAQILNLMIGDDKKTHWNRPFSIFVGGREYGPRSVVGDIMHLVVDPRSFAYFRLNPLWGRPLAEIATGRDPNGRRVNAEDAAKDVVRSWTPIPAQGFVKKNQGDTMLGAVVNSILQSVGITNYQYRSDAEKKMLELMPRIDKLRTPEQKNVSELRSKVIPLLRKGIKLGELPEDLKKKLLKLTDTQLKNIQKDGEVTSLQSGFKHLSAVDAIEVWKKMTPEEKSLLEDDYSAKLARKSREMSEEDYEAFKKTIAEAE